MKLTKRKKQIKEILSRDNIKKNQLYDINEVIELLKNIPRLKFKDHESVDVHIILGIDPTKSDHIIKSASVLPHGNGKKIRVAVFADGEDEKKALEAGADTVGMESLHNEINLFILET